MMLVEYLIAALIVHLVIASPQINLEITDGIDENNVLQHNCLHVPTSIDEGKSREIISYCMDSWPSKWAIDGNTVDPSFTFAELYRMNVTSEQLYSWSAPMNVIEWYQFYVDQMVMFNASSWGTNIFYNCTSPRFGPQCQYSFDAHQSYHSSLNQIIESHYLQAPEPDTLTCYTHLQCDRGSSSVCLDWSEVCDGKVDCIDGKDEENCFSLMNNQCTDDEYRCDNGQCIPQTFFKDGYRSFDCLDRSDEPQFKFQHDSFSHEKPTLINENIICSWRDNLRKTYLDAPLTSSCAIGRRRILEEAMFSDRSSTLSPNCSLAFKCLHNIPYFDNPRCSDLCGGQECAYIIENECPELLFIPAGPIAYGHIYLVFSKESAVNTTYLSRIPPTYIYYHEQLCGEFPSNESSVSMNVTIRRPEDFPIIFTDPSGTSYFSFIKPLFSQLSNCNSILYNQPVVCNGSHVYQCKNSSKCIAKLHVGDGISDCVYNDDEDQATFDELCSIDRSDLFFKCPTTNRCIRRDQIEDYQCDCGFNEYGLCDDEYLRLNEIRRTITYSNICDGFLDLLPIMINGQNETDETNCEHWPCNNTYTRCDGFWNCIDGVDELNCDPSPLIECPPLHHTCVSSLTNALMCLPIERANDGAIDCLGGIDEPTLCTVGNDPYSKEKKFHCENDGNSICLTPWQLCDGYENCKDADDEKFCGNTNYLNTYDPNNTDAQNFFYRYFFHQQRSEFNDRISRSLTMKQSEQHCQRGVPLRVWLNMANNLSTTTCLCPPSYYGDQCQFQNQRVSFTLQLNALAAAQRTLFTLVISLVDDDFERTVHSYQQLTYIHVRDESTKFNFYLLYSTRPKDTTKNYAIQIDVYEKMTLAYRGSSIMRLKFPFLPVERIALKLTLPQVNDRIRTCLDSVCDHGRCIHYQNDPDYSLFCQCDSGWTGRYCNIPYMCTCSSDSLCVGVDANNRSICVCPSDKFGAQCLLNNSMRQLFSNPICYNGGVCLPADEYTVADGSCYCLCPKGFHGKNCEIPDTKIILSFHKDIGLTLPSIVSLRFIHLNGTAAPIDSNSWQVVCSNGTTPISYWSYPFHLALVQLFELDASYYLISDDHNSSNIIRTITSMDRCRSINELFNDTLVQMHPLRRIKYYQVVCQASPDLSCFHDEMHMCFCQDDQRFANCFKFNLRPQLDVSDIENQNIETRCASNSTSNSSTSTSTPLSTAPPTTITNGVSSIHACDYFFGVFILLLVCFHIHCAH